MAVNLGLAGILPIHPKTILRARMYRKKITENYEAGPWNEKLITGKEGEERKSELAEAQLSNE
jgi:hypothetical protein